jgi:hypothetical protein
MAREIDSVTVPHTPEFTHKNVESMKTREGVDPYGIGGFVDQRATPAATTGANAGIARFMSAPTSRFASPRILICEPCVA